MVRPVGSQYPITKRYGDKAPPGHRYAAGFHTGTDFACPVGTAVWSPGPGRIAAIVRNDPAYGNYVTIEGENGKRLWLLAHLSQIAELRVGQVVKRRQRIGLSGKSGNVTGPHLHAEERHPPFRYRDCQKPTGWKER